MSFVRKISQLMHMFFQKKKKKKDTTPFSNFQSHPFLSPRNEHCSGFDVIFKEHFHILLEHMLYTYSVFLLKYMVKAMVFPVVMYGCESWTIKKADSRRIDVFEL